MNSAGYRNRVISPPRYRRQTIGMVCSPPTSDSVPNSARYASTPRSSSALDRKWVHRSQGDLAIDMDVLSHPRLQTEFYQDLYQKYPQAFRRRLEAREAGRKLFNSRPHVRFKDEFDISVDNSSVVNQGSSLSNTHLTNWDREVGYYLRHKSCLRECVTSVEPSECSGSVLSVTQRLRLNSQSLNKLLNDESPLKRHVDRDHVQYDSGTENEQTLQDYILEKSKERSRHRKQQRRIIIQRKIHKGNNGLSDSNKENEFKDKRWLSRSASPTRRHFIKYSLPHTDVSKSRHEIHHVDIESLIADSDLKIDTLLEKISTKMSCPDSPPDSAIDIDTPSVQSFVTADKWGNSGKSGMVLVELPALNGEQTDSGENCVDAETESSPGSSASACVSQNSAKKSSNDNFVRNMASSENSMQIGENFNRNDSLDGDVKEDEPGRIAGEDDAEIDEINKIVEKYASLENLDQNMGAGLLQLYTVGMGYDDVVSVDTLDRIGGNMENHCGKIDDDDDINVDNTRILSRQNTTSSQNDNGNLTPNCSKVGGESEEGSEIRQTIVNENVTAAHNTENRYAEDINNFTRNSKLVENTNYQNYQADDEHEVDVVAMEIVHANNMLSKRMTTHTDSDVDSGIGYSSTCTDALPPRGRAAQREATMRPQPVKADHNILPLRSEVDVDILDEVNLVHLSNDLVRSLNVRGKGSHSTREERDDTDINLGVCQISEKERKIAEKYRRARSPSPYILRNRQLSPGFRLKSAPLFMNSEMDLRVVDISLSNDSISDISNISNVSSIERTIRNDRSSDTQVRTLPNTNAKSRTPCQNTSKFSSMPNLASNESKHTKSHSSNDMSSKLNKQRKYSLTSLSSKGSSISLLSESETDTTTGTQIRNMNYQGAIDDCLSTPHGYYEQEYAKNVDNSRFSDVDLDSEWCASVDNVVDNRQSDINRKKGMYKPSATSPRVKEKRLKLRHILKNKKGSYNPPAEVRKLPDEKNIVNRIYAKERGATDVSDSVEKKTSNTNYAFSRSRSSSELSSPELNREAKHNVRFERNATGNHTGRRTPYESANAIDRETESVANFIAGASGKTVTAKPVILDMHKDIHKHKSNTGKDALINGARTENPRHEVELNDDGAIIDMNSPVKAQPPKKPVRNKNKNIGMLAADLNFSKYKIKGPDEVADLHTGKDTEHSEDTHRSHDSATSKRNGEQNQRNARVPPPELRRQVSMDMDKEIEELEQSNLQRSKALSASKTSLRDKMGGLKTATKGKFKAFKKAISMDQGIDKAGVNRQMSKESKGSHSDLPKMKKAPSLKSFTSLFSRKKKKKMIEIEDSDSISTKASEHSHGIGSLAQSISNGQHQHWASSHSLPAVDSPSCSQPIRKHNGESIKSQPVNQPIRKHSGESIKSQPAIQPIGKLLRINPDGTQVIQLVKPDNGPIGFFIAKGSAKFSNGIFVSRFAATRPEQCFAGLLCIGDEIMEVNGHIVRDFCQDAVYDLIRSSPVIVVKVFPFIARTDV